MKLVAGLGNPGARYQDTRHNLGFVVADRLAARYAVTFDGAPAEAVVARVRAPGPELLIVKPLTFMNLSGGAVAELVRYYRIELPDVLVVVDDVNLPLGRLRARARGSAGGHNGLKSVATHLGTDEYARLRLGVGRGDERRDLADHVVARFQEGEQAIVEDMVTRATEATDRFVTEGIEEAMNAFNRREDAEDGTESTETSN